MLWFNPVLGAALALLFGLLLGSFLNVVIHRLPRMQALASQAPYNLAWPGSHCPRCLAQLRWWHNIPLVSFALLRGRCASCHQSISWRYPLVEATTGVGFAWLAWMLPTPGLLIGAMGLSAALMALALIDFETGLLPDRLTLSLLWSGLLFNLFVGVVPLSECVLGAVLGYGLLWLVYWGFRLISGRIGLGYGDLKLLAALGAWLGWTHLPQVLLISSLTGLLAGGILMLSGRLTRNDPIPFGPFLAGSGWGVWAWSVFI